MKKLIIPVLIAAFALTTFSAAAADTPAARPVPFRGKVDSVNKTAKTFKINDRTFNVTSDTKITKAGKPATFDDVKVGEDASGQYREGADKKLNVVSLRVGPRPDAPAAAPDKK